MHDDGLDIPLGAAAVTHPLWLDMLNAGAQEIMIVGGAVLVLYRLFALARGKKTENEK